MPTVPIVPESALPKAQPGPLAKPSSANLLMATAELKANLTESK